LDTITKLLDIPNYRAIEVKDSEDKNIYIVLEREEDTPPVCSGCENIHGKSVHSGDAMIVEDLKISSKRFFLLVPKRNLQCAEDGTIRVEDIQWLNGRFTTRFAEQVYMLTPITT